MREKYTTPEMEVIEFEVEDIITASDDYPLIITPEPDETPIM